MGRPKAEHRRASARRPSAELGVLGATATRRGMTALDELGVPPPRPVPEPEAVLRVTRRVRQIGGVLRFQWAGALGAPREPR